MKVQGLQEATQALRELDRKAQKRIVRKALRAGGKVIQDKARTEAPTRTGALKRNVKIRGGRASKGSVALNIGIGARDFTGKTFYGGFVQYGHRIGKRALGSKRKLVPPNEFLTRAFDATKEQAVTVVVQALGELLEPGT